VEVNLWTLFERVAAAVPDREAIIWREQRLTSAALAPGRHRRAARARRSDDQLRRREGRRRGGRAGPAAKSGGPDDELRDAGAHIAHYKLPTGFVRVDTVLRSQAGEADDRWARQIATVPQKDDA